MQYAGAVLAGIVVGLICKAYFAAQMQTKIRGYQSDIVKSHSKILELEAKNGHLEKLLKDVDKTFTRDQLFMNWILRSVSH